jgi:hypothetical protein
MHPFRTFTSFIRNGRVAPYHARTVSVWGSKTGMPRTPRPPSALPDRITDFDHFRVRRHDHAGGVTHEYRLVAWATDPQPE